MNVGSGRSGGYCGQLLVAHLVFTRAARSLLTVVAKTSKALGFGCHDGPQRPSRACQDLGRVAEAIPLFEQTLADRERFLDPNHPDTLISRGICGPDSQGDPTA